MSKNSNKNQELKQKIRLENLGLQLTSRAMNDLPEGSDLHDMFKDQLGRIEERVSKLVKQLKKGKKTL